MTEHATTGTDNQHVEYIEQRGRYADEMAEGQVYLHRPGRTLTEADNVAFTTLTMNPQALHLDHAFAATQPFGKPLMNSMMTLSTLVGLAVGQTTQGTLVAQLGLGEIAFPAPVFHGDTLYAQSRVAQIRESSSRPGQRIVTFEMEGTNQRGETVVRCQRVCLMWTKQAHEDAKAAARVAAASAGTDDATAADGEQAGEHA
ncbi:MAG: MaoC family dehydratase [Micrococcus sp.]|nr:MaoC family dehydratase [Micrococcus sp.]